MPMRRDIFSEEHDLFREQFRRFVGEEVEPHIVQWNADGIVPRAIWKRMGDEGYLGANMPEEYGGAGGDFLYDAVIMEELAYARAHCLQASLHTDICLPYLETYGTEAQKREYLAPAIAGDCLVAIAMTEPSTGSDLAAIRTSAIRDGDDYVVNGAKTFISNGQNCHLVITVVKTDPSLRHDGMSLLLVEAGTPGFERGRNLDKIGLKGQDTSELFFHDCRVPVENLLGQEGQGFKMLMEKLQQERLCIAIASMASVRRSLDDTLAYVKEREAFGKPIGSFQNTQFKLAEMETEYEVGQAFTDKLLAAHVRGEEIVSEVSMGKWWASDLQKKVAAECLQLHGGYGFMSEYPISQDYQDAAVQSIYAGSNEIMKVIIAKRLGLG
jgi:alkylation response protein AidB-like acyl-CoA dehydrogenase